VLHELRRGLDEVRCGTGATEVLVAGTAEEGVQGMPKLVQKGFELAVREPSLELKQEREQISIFAQHFVARLRSSISIDIWQA